MSDTGTNRGYAWALQSDFVTQKPIAAGALKQMLASDSNLIDYTPETKDNEEWAHGVNSATEQWIESHDCSVAHTIPGHSQEMGKVFLLNCGDYAPTVPTGGTLSKLHTFKPTDPNVTRQDKAVTYAEKLGAGWNVLMPRAVSDGWTLKSEGKGLLMLDFKLLGAGLIIPNSGVTWAGVSPTVAKLNGLHKLFNTQVSLVVTDGGVAAPYTCRYRNFQADYKKTMLSEAGFKPGCADFFVAGEPTSGIIRSEHEFDKQMLDFSFTVDMGTSSPEFLAVQQQKPLDILFEATGGTIEGTIRHKLALKIPVAYYKTSKPSIVNNIASFAVSGKAFFDFVTNKLFSLELTNDVANYATAW